MSMPSVIAALLTPFGNDGEVDAQAARAHLGMLLGAGVDGVLVGGTTGEGVLLDDHELLRLCELCVDCCGGQAEVLVQVGRPATTMTIALARRAVESGVDGVLVVAPYYYELDARQLVAHHRAVVDAVPEAPVLAYNIPSRTGNDLDADIIRELASLGLAGLKDSTKSLDRHHAYLEVARATPGFRVFVGSDSLARDSLAAGSAGLITAVANVAPELLIELRQAVLDGDEARAETLQAQVSDVRDQASPSPAGVKAAVRERLQALGEDYPTALRAPLGPAPVDRTVARPAAPRLGLLTPFKELPGEYSDVAFASGVNTWQVVTEAADSHAPDDLRALADLAPLKNGIERLLRWHPVAVMWACTSGSFIDGAQAAIEQSRALSEAAGVPVRSTSLAFVSALRALGLSRVNLVASYPEEATTAFADFLGEFGIAVEDRAHLDADGASAAERLTAYDYTRGIEELHDPSLPLLLPDTATWGFELQHQLEPSCPMTLSANQVTLWLGLALLGRTAEDVRFGALRNLAVPGTQELAELI
jgi:dihydrodipicolinate synthase/N-acetylneuraminate lyase/maleate cis-trans isomerase